MLRSISAMDTLWMSEMSPAKQQEHKMNIRINGGEWVGSWKEFVLNNASFDMNDLADALISLESTGKAEIDCGLGFIAKLEVVK